MKLKLRGKLLLLAAVPLVGLLWVSLSTTVEKVRLVRELEQLHEIVGASTQIGALVHEVQKERGMSSGFLGSRGANFATELPAQRAKTDVLLKDIDRVSGQLQALPDAASLRAPLEDLRRNLAELAAARTAVSSQAFTAAQSAAYYTKLIASLLAVPDQTARLSSTPLITARAAAYGA